ncbi:tigger transposable element-derived protein 6-like [Argopecten irradians]|uniref:tigger transposable element-derived protein 6-like n=1 Tax=Argopecten irradians TaxID=31199 RepID=UPI003722D482
MTDFQTARCSSEGPGTQPGGIARIGSTEQFSEGPGVKSGGITGSVFGKGLKRKLESKSYDVKYEAIMEVEKGVKSKKQIAADFGIPQSTLSTWMKNNAQIKQKFLSGEVGPQRKKSRNAKFPEVEQALLAWFNNARAQNVTVSGEILREKARFFAERLGIKSNEFDCSTGWLERFKSRHSITFKRVCGESNDVQSSSKDMSEWKAKLASILKDYDADSIYNADETGIFYRLLPDKTLEYKSVSCHGGKQSKERLTAMVCSNMSGSDKLPLLVIGKSQNPRCFKNIKTLPTLYRANKKAWMTSELFIEWLRKFDDRMSRKKKSVVMIIDNCPAHPTVKNLKSVKLVFLPPNTTSVT